MAQLVTIPCLKDNYAFLVHDDASGTTLLFDVPEAEPVLAELSARNWALTHILLTHHHWDHIDGLTGIDLSAGPAAGARVIGAAADAHRLPPLTRAVAPGDTLALGPFVVEVIDVPGHTVGHIAYALREQRLAFTGDSLMSMGCGRLFEGAPAQMWDSLCRLAALPDDTLVCSGHEYTEANLRFAESLGITPALAARAARIHAARAENRPTVPTTLLEEKATNPFLRASDPALKQALGVSHLSDAEVFAILRLQKDRF